LGEALADIAKLGIKRILTSGGKPDVPAGLSEITTLVKEAGARLSLMPGGGVTEKNLADIVRATGVREIHLSARSGVKSGMVYRNETCSMGSFSTGREYEWREASAEKVRLAKQALAEGRRGAQGPE
jgi:copper homeostasis protein